MTTGVDGIGAEADDVALGTAADGTRQMQGGGGGRAARDDEATQRRQLGVRRVDPLLQARHVGVGEARAGHAGRDAGTGSASCAPTANRSCWMRSSQPSIVASRPAPRAWPSTAFSSSTWP